MILVTGATGSVGGNVCRLAAARGIDVRALVRPGSAVDTLVALGVEPVVGDVTDRASLDVASRGVDGVVHCAAQIGGTWSTAEPKDFEAVNQRGTINVLDAAQAAPQRTVVLLSAVVNDRRVTATETSPIAPLETSNSPYLRTKLAAYYEGMARAARGADVNFVVPGGVYGPTPFVERALVPTIFTGTLLTAARGELRRYLPMPIPWVLAEDVADIALRTRSNLAVPGTATWRWDDRVTRARSPSSATPSSNWPGSTTGSRSSTPPVQGRTTTRSSDRW